MTKKKNYPGMFDLIKGYAMITIVVVHTLYLAPFDSLPGNIPPVLFGLMGALITFLLICHPLMPLFFMISGYSFSATSMKKCIKKQTHILLKPYLITALFTVIVFFFSQLAHTGELWESAVATSRTALRYLLGVPEQTMFFGIQLKAIGAIWYVLALFIGWLLLNAITLYVPERLRPLTVFACVCTGYLIGQNFIALFCLSQGFVSVGFLYAGQLMKKNDWLFGKLSIPCWCVLIFLSLFSFLFGDFDMASSSYKYGLLDMAGVGCYAFLLARGAVLLNQYSNALTDRLRKIGRYSLWVMCAHTVESNGLFWGVFAKRFGEHQWIAFFTIVILRFILVFFMCQMVIKYNKIRSKRKRSARQHSLK